MYTRKYVCGIILICLVASGIIYTSTAIANISDKQSKSTHTDAPKQKGIHVFGGLDSISLDALQIANFNWITLVPFVSQNDYDSANLSYGSFDSINILQKKAYWKLQINMAHDRGIKVCLKPHIWIDNASHGKWRSDIYPNSDEDWQLWQSDYMALILFYAEIASENNVSLFCIGTELTALSTRKSNFWRSLISDLRKVYDGKLIYAANWYKEYESIDFWDQLDYIGVQAYFPLTNSQSPNITQISKGWVKHAKRLAQMANKLDKKIIFTEIGYKSEINAAIRPWEWIDYNDNTIVRSTETQANCYQSFFDVIWNNEWFGGAQIWQYNSRNSAENLKNDKDFTIQGKPAMQIIADGFLD